MYFFTLAIPFFHDFREFNLLVHKSAGKFHISGIAFVNSIFSLFPQLGHVFDKRGLFITCMYFYLSPTPFLDEFGEFNLEIHKSEGQVHISWIAFANSIFFLFLLLAHVFDNRGLFRTCMYFFPLPYTFFP